ncbi:MAG: hypothetical protein JWO08_2095 [Verrucomicrobiaceae bacterium]|nr:hypothetical protein [Verrucomicrobiaceae bacterium]
MTRATAIQWLRRSLWFLVLTGILLHVTVRDRIDAFAVFFYMLPLPVLIGLTMAIVIIGRGRRRRASLVAIGLSVAWLYRSFTWHPTELATQDDVRVLFWNLGHPIKPFRPLIRMIKELNPDIVACVEPGPNAATDVEAYKAALPGYDCQAMPRGILWLSRRPSQYRARGRLDQIGAYAVFEAQINGRTQRVVTADVYAAPLLPRTGQLREILDYTQSDPKVIAMGDFNTPAESAHFDAYRQQQLQDALTTGGKGFRETWFWGLPLLSLDHIWLGKDWHVMEARKIWTFDTDHAAVFVRVR